MTTALPTNGMSSLEVIGGAVWGADPEVPPLPPAPAGLTARAALESAVRGALQRPPCVVSFSGGRDSSAMLALAMHVARREGLPLPVPVTFRVPGYEPAGEDDWQEMVVRHLGVRDWNRLVFDDELDAVGPYASRVLARHGLMWPPNVYAHLPIAEQGAGGTLLTGAGGDQALTTSRLHHRANEVLMGRVAPRPRDVLRVGYFYAPRAVRRRAMHHRIGRLLDPWSWLAPEVERAVRAAMVEAWIAEPLLRWDDSITRGRWRARTRRLTDDSLARVAAMSDVLVVSPLNDPTFLAAFGAGGGRLGPRSRTDAMRWLFGDLLPEKLLARNSKAEMGGAFLNRQSREFAAAWDGTGLDSDLIRIDTLRAMWTDPERVVDSRSFQLLHTAWLATNRASPEP